MTAESTLNVLLIEDNPGDVRLIEEMLRGSDQLLQWFDAGDDPATEATIQHEEALEGGFERLSETDVDVILLDLGLPEYGGLGTLAAVTDETAFVPTVVLTGLSDEGIGVEGARGATRYLAADVQPAPSRRRTTGVRRHV
jgi:CheY-like chemotaxis protein